MEKKKDYISVAFSNEQLAYYCPENFRDYKSACRQLVKDCKDVAVHEGYSRKQVFMPVVDFYKERIKVLWEE